MTISNDFQEDPPRSYADLAAGGGHESDAFLLNIDGYEGPIDVLLEMARTQKVDLAQISILQLVRQYLAFVDRAKELRLDLAAEYLVMAAWLAYLKSRLLLPQEEQNEEEPTAEEMAAALAYQLRRLEAMRNAADQLMERAKLMRGVFGRGQPEGWKTKTKSLWDVTLYELLSAYGDIRVRKESGIYAPPTFHLVSAEEAMARLQKMLGQLPKKGRFTVWTTLESFLAQNGDKLYTRSSFASTFTATLEMAKQGKLEIRQDGPFRPVYLRAAVEGEYDTETTENDNPHEFTNEDTNDEHPRSDSE